MTVAHLRPAERPRNEGLVELLRGLLREAEEGTLTAMIGCAERVAGETSTFRAVNEHTDAAKLVFGLETAKFRLLAMQNLEEL